MAAGANKEDDKFAIHSSFYAQIAAVTGGMCLAGRAIHASFYVEMATGVFKKDAKNVTHSSFYMEMAAGVTKNDDKSVTHASFYV